MSLRSLACAVCLLAGSAAAAQTGALQVKDAWARATPGAADVGAAYLTIVSPAPDRLVAVSSPVAREARLHETTMADGVMQMRPKPELDIPAGEPVILKPGGMHIMLQGLNQPLREGGSFALDLTFEKAGRREVTVAVEKPGAMGPGQ
jgi:copper(I)-binding protein